LSAEIINSNDFFLGMSARIATKVANTNQAASFTFVESKDTDLALRAPV
jgi:hypothetical protein